MLVWYYINFIVVFVKEVIYLNENGGELLFIIINSYLNDTYLVISNK